jgi:hypothetical protein
MANYSSGKTKIYVSASLPSTEDSAGYAALSWTQVVEASALSDYGPTYNINEHTPLATAVVSKNKGSVNYGNPTLDVARDASDAGQAILVTASSSYCPISFKVEHNDIPCTGGSSGTIEYFKGLVNGKTSTGLGGPDNTDGLSFPVEIVSVIVNVAPT